MAMLHEPDFTTPVVFARKPFASVGFGRDGDTYRGAAPEGTTLAEIVASVPDLPLAFWEFGQVCINGDVVPRHLWGRVRPKANIEGRPVVVTMHLAPFGGGGSSKKGGSGKSIIAVVAAIAIIAVASFISAGGLATLAPGLFSASLFGSGTIGAALAAAAVSSIGLMALNALTPTPSVESETFSDRSSSDRASSADGNIVSPGGIIPRVIGSYRVYPPLIVTPLIDLVDDDEIIEAVYALAGPHSMTDVRVDSFPADDLDEVSYQVREGFTDDDDINLIERYGIVDSPQIELTTHVVDEEVKRKFKHVSTPDIDLPVWHGAIVPSEPDEIWLQLIAPQGYYDQIDDDDLIAVPLRIRVRQEGETTWINFPEVHLVNRIQSAFRRMIRIKLVAGSGDVPSAPTPPTTYGWRNAYREVPPQTTNNPGGAPSTGGWTADAHFATGAGFQDTQNVHLEAQDVTFYLYGATFAGTRRWEIQIIRGALFIRGSFTDSTYVYAGLGTNVHDFFGYKVSDGSISGTIAGDPVVPASQENRLSTTALLRTSAVYNTLPVVRPSTEQACGLALLVMKGRNKNFTKVSVQAGGYVPDWDGAEWANLVVTSNPAPHFRDILVGPLNYDQLPPSIIDDDNLLEWRQICTDNEYTVDLISEGRSIAELLATICGCGRAMPRLSDLLGVMIDVSRAGETPVQIFTPRNSNGFRFDVPFTKRPDGYIVSYRNSDVGYEEDQIIVYDPESSPETADRFESITIEGIVEQTKVVRRMEFDAAQLRYRPATYVIDTDIEYLVCRRGDLVGLSHDVIQPRAGFARIKEININAGNVESILVDNELQLSTGTDFFALTNVFTEADIFITGIEFGVAIRLANGSIATHQLSSVGLTDLLEFATPFATPATLLEDCLVTVGEVSQEYGRFIVKEVAPQNDLTARLVLVQEAPEIHGEILEEDFSDDAVTTSSALKLLLHFDGADAATGIIDDKGHTFTAAGNAQLDTAQAKFGNSSLLLDGTGDWVSVADSADFNLGAGDFTIDFWFNCNAAGGTTESLAGQCDAAGAATSTSFRIQRNTSNVINAFVCSGSTFFTVTGTTQFTSSVNTGWHHVALVRNGSDLKLFIDGTQEGSTTAIAATVNDSASELRVGMDHAGTADPWTGWIDEFRMHVGVALWTANFTPPTEPAGVPPGWTSRWNTSGTLYEIQTAAIAGSVSGKEMKCTRSGSDSRSLITIDELGSVYTDVEVTVSMYVVAHTASASEAGPALRASGILDLENGYTLRMVSNAGATAGTGIQVVKYVAGVSTALGSVTAFVWAVNTRYWIKFSAIGPYLKGKIWADGDPEPTDWMLQEYDESVAGPGWIGFSAFTVASDPAFDYISVKTLEVIKE